MEVVENQQLDEAKVEKNLSPSEKEDVRNQRTFGSTSSKNRATGMRRTFSAAERGVKKETPSGNEKSEISGRFNRTGAELRREIRQLKGRKSGRDFSKKVKQELAAKKYVEQQNSDFAAKNAENKISKFRREELDLYDIILSHLLDEGYADTEQAAEAIMVNMSEEWRESICEAEIEPPKERVGALTNIDIPMSEREAARQRTLAKAKAKREKNKN
jgi:hypothetical protein